MHGSLIPFNPNQHITGAMRINTESSEGFMRAFWWGLLIGAGIVLAWAALKWAFELLTTLPPAP